MRLDISRMSRILPILSILILGGFQTTSAIEYLITSTLGGTNKVQDITATQGDSIAPLQVYVYLKYTSAEVTAGGGSGWLLGNLLFSSSDSSTAYMNGAAAPSTATSQAGAYTVQNVGATGTTANNWNAPRTGGGIGITAVFTADRATLQATYEADGSPSNVFGTSSTNYLYLATATLTFDTTSAGTTSIAANRTGFWSDDNFIDYSPTLDSFNITINAVPEPTTYALAALSCVALGAIGRRKTLKAKKQETASA